MSVVRYAFRTAYRVVWMHSVELLRHVIARSTNFIIRHSAAAAAADVYWCHHLRHSFIHTAWRPPDLSPASKHNPAGDNRIFNSVTNRPVFRSADPALFRAPTPKLNATCGECMRQCEMASKALWSEIADSRSRKSVFDRACAVTPTE